MANENKFLDYAGVEQLWDKIKKVSKKYAKTNKGPQGITSRTIGCFDGARRNKHASRPVILQDWNNGITYNVKWNNFEQNATIPGYWFPFAFRAIKISTDTISLDLADEPRKLYTSLIRLMSGDILYIGDYNNDRVYFPYGAEPECKVSVNQITLNRDEDAYATITLSNITGNVAWNAISVGTPIYCAKNEFFAWPGLYTRYKNTIVQSKTPKGTIDTLSPNKKLIDGRIAYDFPAVTDNHKKYDWIVEIYKKHKKNFSYVFGGGFEYCPSSDETLNDFPYKKWFDMRKVYNDKIRDYVGANRVFSALINTAIEYSTNYPKDHTSLPMIMNREHIIYIYDLDTVMTILEQFNGGILKSAGINYFRNMIEKYRKLPYRAYPVRKEGATIFKRYRNRNYIEGSIMLLDPTYAPIPYDGVPNNSDSGDSSSADSADL